MITTLSLVFIVQVTRAPAQITWASGDNDGDKGGAAAAAAAADDDDDGEEITPGNIVIVKRGLVRRQLSSWP